MSNHSISPIRYIKAEENADLHTLLLPINKFAASFGLQPFQVIVTRGRGAKPGTSEWVFVFAARTKITKSDIDQFIESVGQGRTYPLRSLSGYRKEFENSINVKDPGGITWAERQARHALDILLTTVKRLNAGYRITEQLGDPGHRILPTLEESGYRPFYSVKIKSTKQESYQYSNN